MKELILRKIWTIASVLFCLVLGVTTSQARMSPNDGIISARSLPNPVMSHNLVLLDVPHIRQNPWHCVPTFSAMVLRYFGENHVPAQLKAWAEVYKPASKRNVRFTYWKDMQHALGKIGKRWEIRNYAQNSTGFSQGFAAIKSSLRKGNPVLIDVHLGYGHTFIVIGFDEIRKVVYVRDPDIAEKYARAISYAQLRADWNNHRFSKSRNAFFTRR